MIKILFLFYLFLLIYTSFLKYIETYLTNNNIKDENCGINIIISLNFMYEFNGSAIQGIDNFSLGANVKHISDISIIMKINQSSYLIYNHINIITIIL